MERVHQSVMDPLAERIEEAGRLIGREAVEFSHKGGNYRTGLQMDHYAATLNASAQTIRRGVFKVFFGGKFNTGKSTLLNAIIGRRLLIARQLPATAVPTILANGSESRAAVYRFGQADPEMIDFEEYQRRYRLSPQDQVDNGNSSRFSSVDRIEFRIQHPFTAGSVQFIDSPGLEENDARTRLVLEYIQSAHAVVVVLNATSLMTAHERSFIASSLPPCRLKGVFFCVTHIDHVPADELDEAREYLEAVLLPCFTSASGESDLELYGRRVFLMNASAALEARLANPLDHAALENSGILPFEAELASFLGSPDKLNAAVQHSRDLLSTACVQASTNIQLRREAIQQPLEILEAQYKIAQREAAEIERHAIRIDQAIRSAARCMAQKAADDLRLYTLEMERTWPQYAQRALALGDVDFFRGLKLMFSRSEQAKLTQRIGATAVAYQKTSFDRWLERVGTITEEDRKALERELATEITPIHLSMKRLQEAVGGCRPSGAQPLGEDDDRKAMQVMLSLMMLDPSGATGALLGETSWTSFGKRAGIQAGTALVLTSILSGGALAVALLLAEGIHIFIQLDDWKERLRAKVGTELHKAIRQQVVANRENLEAAFQQQIEQGALTFTKELRDKVNQTAELLSLVIDQKQTATLNADSECGRLNAIEGRLQELLNEVNQLTLRQVEVVSAS